jgi:hypothetical protein
MVKKGVILKKVLGYAIYKNKILSCHKKKGFKGWYWEKTKGNYVRPGVSAIRHSTKTLANKALKAKLSKTKGIKSWVSYKITNGKWGVRECIKRGKTVSGKKIIIREYTNGNTIPKSFRCYTNKSTANKISDNKNKLLESAFSKKMKRKVKKKVIRKVMKKTTTRSFNFGRRMYRTLNYGFGV